MRKSRISTLAIVALLVAACSGAAPVVQPTPQVITPGPVVQPTPQVITPGPVVQPTPQVITPEPVVPTPEPTAAPVILPTVPTGYAELDQALGAGKPFDGKPVSVQVQWIGAEGAAFETAVAAFEAATGIDLVIDHVGSNHEVVLQARVEGDAAPDIAQIAQPATMAKYANRGKLVELSSFMDKAKLGTDYADAFLNLTTVDSKIYGVFYKADVKSTVWYPIKAFADAGYEVPTTWEELVALSDKIVTDGNGNPWCISIEHGGATGWVATDWVEDVLLRTAPAQTYQDWISHKIPFNDPAIKAALDTVGSVWFKDGYAYGGKEYINATWVGQTMDPMFEQDLADPQCWMQKQATWYDGFFPDLRANPDIGTSKYVTGKDVGIFYFPGIDAQYGTPALGAGDLFMAFNDRPEVRAAIEFLATPASIATWIQSSGVTSANRSTPSEWYAGSYKAGVAAQILANASTLGFDASDSMPKEVGSGSFWSGMVDWVSAGGTNTDQVLQTIEDSWPQ
ncbi:MAG: alpha-glucoside transport system substrate-binding protein [Chloroflexota bacterium]|jgi:alpha-glucoside transport system substrate-binding protein|nr:alpha-glucoside transport system substrate-binding protein [Chloroflexota bacterium]